MHVFFILQNIYDTPINSDNYVKIDVVDANDEIPKFLNIDPQTGNIGLSVLENEAVGTSVQSVSAIDADETALFKEVIMTEVFRKMKDFPQCYVNGVEHLFMTYLLLANCEMEVIAQ